MLRIFISFVVFSLGIFSLRAQNLSISTSGQTGTSGTNWSITGNTLNVGASGSAALHPDVISNHLNTVGNLTVILPAESGVIRQCIIDGSITYTGSATRTLTFFIANDILFENVGNSISATNGALNVVLRAANSNASPDNGRVSIRNTNTINTNGGHLWIGGGGYGGNVTWNGLTVGAESARTWDNDVPGLWIENATITTNGGNIYLAGRSHNTSTSGGTNYGINIENSTISSQTGTIDVVGDLRGMYQNGVATRIFSSTGTNIITSTTGAINILGTGSDQDPNDNGWRNAIYLGSNSTTNSNTVSTTSGTITIQGDANFTATVNDKEGVILAGTGLKIVSQTGNIAVKGSNSLETSGQYSNSIRFHAGNVANAIRIGYDGTNAYSGNILIEGNSIYQRLQNSGAGSIAIQTTGNLTIQSKDNAFTYMRAGNAGTLTYDDDWNFGANLGSFTFGKTTNTSNITLSSDITVNGPISVMGGNVTINANITSSANGDILIKGIGNANPCISINSGRTINKSAGSGTLTLQGNARVTNSGTISATGTGVMNVVMWSDFDNSNNDGGVSQFGTISTNGGHVWLGGSNTNGGSYTWNGLTVGDGPSIGSSGYNGNGLDIYGNITTNGGDFLAWAGNGVGGGVNGIGTITGYSVNVGSGNIVLITDAILGTGLSLFFNQSGGSFTLVPNDGDFGTTFNWDGVTDTVAGFGTGWNFGGNFNYLWLENPASLTSLTIGKYDGMLNGSTPVVLSNSSNVTFSNTTATSIAGPISIHGGNITISQNLTSSLANADILLQATGYIDLSASRTIQTNNGNITFRANAGGTANTTTSAIRLNSGSSLLSNGGNITLGGNFDGTEGTGLYAASARVGGSPGILINVATLSAAGGDISIYGRCSTSYDDGIRLQATITTTGAGSIGIYGDAFGGLTTGSPDVWFGGITFITNSSTIETENGNINVEGVLTNTQSNGTYALNFYRSVYTSGTNTRDIQIISKTGDIQITGDRGTTSAGGMGSSSWGDIYFGSPLNGSWTASGDVKFSYSSFVGAGVKGFKVKTTGAVTYEPSAASFANAQTFPHNSNYVVADGASSLTIGKTTNTANITMAASTTVAGPITVYGGNINVNENLNTTAGTTSGNILLKGSGDVILAASKSITTSGAPVILWANSDNEAANGSIALRNGSSIVTGSGSVAGGHVWIGGGSNGTTWNGLAVGSGYAVPGTIFTPSNGGGTLQSGIYLERNSISSFGGNIKIAGDGAATARGIVSYGNTIAINAGSGKIELDGQVTSSATGNRGGILFGLHDNTIISTVNISSSASAGDAITINGVGRGTEDAIGLSGTLNITSSGGGNIVMNGNALGSGRSIVAGNYYHGIMNIFANSGNISLNGNTKAVQVATQIINGLTSGPSKINIGQGGTISSSSSDVFITADNIALAAGGIAINTSGEVTVEPSSASFASAVSFPITNLSIANTIIGLTIGKPTNTASVTIASPTTIAGPISIYGGTVALNQNIESSNGSTITLFANTLNFASGKTVTSYNGQLIVAPQNPAVTIGMAGASGNLSLPTSYFSDNFSDGFSNIQIGSANQTGAIITNAFNLQDNMTLLTSGTLTLGGNPVLGANNMTLGEDINTIDVGVAQNYFKSDSTGRLNRQISDGNSRLLPIGRAHYNPVTITNNSGSADVFSAGVLDSVFLNGFVGPLIETPHVKVTWDLDKQNANGGNGIQAEFGWFASQEEGLMSSYRLNHHNGTNWEFAAGISEDVSGDAFKTMVHINYLGSFSPFAISEDGSPLPVEFLGMQYECLNQQGVALTWQTASELNAQHFEVMRSEDGFTWEKVGTVGATGTTNQISEYQFVDEKPVRTALRYYQLKQVDFDGNFEWLPIISVNCEAGEGMRLYPNPAQHKAYLSIPSNVEELITIQLIDATGRVVMTTKHQITKGDNIVELALTALQNGIYTIVLENDNKQQPLKLIINK